MAFSLNNTNVIFSLLTPAVSYPISLMGWFRVPDVNMQLPLMGIWDSTSSMRCDVLFAGNTTKVAMVRAKSGVTEAVADSSPMIPGTWHHLVAVFASETSRTIYVDGGNAGVNTDNVSTSPYSFLYSGNMGSGTFVDVAEVSTVNAEVSAEQAAALASGCPMLSTPLVRQVMTYYDFIRHPNRPGLGQPSLPGGTPIVINHPRVFSSSGGISAAIPLRIGGPWQTKQAEFHPLSTKIGQHAVAGVGANHSILSGEVIT